MLATWLVCFIFNLFKWFIFCGIYKSSRSDTCRYTLVFTATNFLFISYYISITVRFGNRESTVFGLSSRPPVPKCSTSRYPNLTYTHLSHIANSSHFQALTKAWWSSLLNLVKSWLEASNSSTLVSSKNSRVSPPQSNPETQTNNNNSNNNNNNNNCGSNITMQNGKQATQLSEI